MYLFFSISEIVFDTSKFQKSRNSKFETFKIGHLEMAIGTLNFGNFTDWKFQNSNLTTGSLKMSKLLNLGILKIANPANDISRISCLSICVKMGTGNDEDPRQSFFKILDMKFISIKNHEMQIW